MIAAVVVTFKDVDATLVAVRSLLAARPAPDLVVVVENGSPAPFPERLVAAVTQLGDPRVSVVRSSRNLGFAGGVNEGWRFAARRPDLEAVLLLNNDATVDAGFLGPLADAIRQPDVGIATGTIHHVPPREAAWYAGGELAWWQCRGRHGSVPGAGPRDVTFATGCLMLIRGDLMRHLGGLPELYFLYYEDVEFSIRTIAAGRRIRYVPQSIAFHAIGGSTGHRTIAPRTAFVSSRNRLWVARRNLAGSRRYLAMANIVADEVGRSLGALSKGRAGVAGAIARGVWAGLFVTPDDRAGARYADELERRYAGSADA